MTTIKLSDGQAEACDKLERWWRNEASERPFRLDGYAGTGKTTAVEHFLARLGLRQDDVRLLAPTGKAARVLANRTGWPATTIHRELYLPSESEEVLEIKRALRDLPEGSENDDERRRLRRELAKAERRGGVTFSSKDGETSALLYVVDEASMVDERVAEDLSQVKVPKLLLGDPGQLPPVKGRSGFASIQPDVTLTEILRQDEGSSILEAADLIRRGKGLPDVCDWGAFRRVRPRELADTEYAAFDMLLCGTHKVRKAFNRRLRRQVIGEVEDDPWLPREGDRLVCRANDYRRKLLNGQLLTATGDAEEVDDLRLSVDLVDDEEVERAAETASQLRFQDHYLRNVAVHRVDRAVELDFAYALTVHSAQGSEWDRVVVLNDWSGKQARQWLYTALTRGAEEVVLVG